MTADEVTALSLVEVAEAIARGDVSSVAATVACLGRLRRFGPALNCVVRLEADEALAAAEQADRDRAQGRLRGRLHGVPLAHKDLFYRRGKIVAGGSKIRRDFVADRTATVLDRLERAGALTLGSLHMAEFALSPTGYNEHYGHCRNPWNPAHVPGGSSSGSGAAVAARLVFGSLGSDTGGSIRHPAAMCGVVGIKPTQTRVSRAGIMPVSASLDCVGPLARTARDCARLLSLIAGPDAADPTASARPVPDFEAGLTGDIRGLRIAVPRAYYYEHVTDEVRGRLDNSLRTLRDCGAVVIEVGVPDMTLINALAHVVMAVEMASLHATWLRTRPQDYAEQVRIRMEPGLLYPATRYSEALALRGPVLSDFLAATLAHADVLHLPAISIPVPTIAATTGGGPAAIAAVISLITHCTRGINYLGLPAVSVPAGFTPDGLPVGFQLVGRPFAEGLLLRVADAYQRATDWHHQAPPPAGNTGT